MLRGLEMKEVKEYLIWAGEKNFGRTVESWILDGWTIEAIFQVGETVNLPYFKVFLSRNL